MRVLERRMVLRMEFAWETWKAFVLVFDWVFEMVIWSDCVRVGVWVVASVWVVWCRWSVVPWAIPMERWLEMAWSDVARVSVRVSATE